MKQFFLLVIAALLIDFVLFAVMYGVLSYNFYTSLNLGLSAAAGGLGAAFIQMNFEKKRRNSINRAKN